MSPNLKDRRARAVVVMFLVAVGGALYVRRFRTRRSERSEEVVRSGPTTGLGETDVQPTATAGALAASPGSPSDAEPSPTAGRSDHLRSEERLALRSIRSLETRGSAPSVAEVSTHLGSSAEVEVDENGLGQMLDRFVSEGLAEQRAGGYLLTSSGETALLDLNDDTSSSTPEPDAVELKTPKSTAPTSDPFPLVPPTP